MPRWLLWCVLALLSFGGWAVAPKGLSSEVSAFAAQALSTVGLVPFLAMGFTKRSRQGSWKGAALAFFAGLFVAGGNIPYYEALRLGGRAMTVVPLTALYPLVTVALALLFLGEKPHPIQAGGVALAFAAMYFFNPLAVRPDLRSLGLHALLPILLWGIAALLQKLSTNHASSELASFWFLTGMVCAGPAIVFYGEVGVAGHSPRDWALLFLIGFLFGLGNLALIAAYGSGGKASIVTPLAGLYSVIAIPLAMIFGERPRPGEVAGIALALAAVVALSYERQKETERVGQAS